MTYRRKGHAEHDNQSYVTAGEIERWAARTTRSTATSAPLDRDVRLAAAELEGIDARVQVELDAALSIAEQSPAPQPEALHDVYADPPAAAAWYRRL